MSGGWWRPPPPEPTTRPWSRVAELARSCDPGSEKVENFGRKWERVSERERRERGKETEKKKERERERESLSLSSLSLSLSCSPSLALFLTLFLSLCFSLLLSLFLNLRFRRKWFWVHSGSEKVRQVLLPCPPPRCDSPGGYSCVVGRDQFPNTPTPQVILWNFFRKWGGVVIPLFIEKFLRWKVAILAEKIWTPNPRTFLGLKNNWEPSQKTTYKLPRNYVQTSRNSRKFVRTYKLTKISGSLYVYMYKLPKILVSLYVRTNLLDVQTYSYLLTYSIQWIVAFLIVLVDLDVHQIVGYHYFNHHQPSRGRSVRLL